MLRRPNHPSSVAAVNREPEPLECYSTKCSVVLGLVWLRQPARQQTPALLSAPARPRARSGVSAGGLSLSRPAAHERSPRPQERTPRRRRPWKRATLLSEASYPTESVRKLCEPRIRWPRSRRPRVSRWYASDWTRTNGRTHRRRCRRQGTPHLRVSPFGATACD